MLFQHVISTSAIPINIYHYPKNGMLPQAFKVENNVFHASTTRFWRRSNTYYASSRQPHFTYMSMRLMHTLGSISNPFFLQISKWEFWPLNYVVATTHAFNRQTYATTFLVISSLNFIAHNILENRTLEMLIEM